MRAILYSDLVPKEMEFLKKYVPSAGTIVEIGTGDGGTAAFFREISTANIYTIDPYPGPKVIETLATVGVVGIQTTSKEAAELWNGSIDLLYIDGAHDFESIITDIELWTPKLSPNGVVVFDDYSTTRRGGLANLAVKVCLDTLLASGVLHQIDRKQKLLVATVNRCITLEDIEICIGTYLKLSRDDGSERAFIQNFADRILADFWAIKQATSDKVRFRLWAESHQMLELVQLSLGVPYDLRSLSNHIAIEQSKLNINRLAFQDIQEENQ